MRISCGYLCLDDSLSEFFTLLWLGELAKKVVMCALLALGEIGLSFCKILPLVILALTKVEQI